MRFARRAGAGYGCRPVGDVHSCDGDAYRRAGGVIARAGRDADADGGGINPGDGYRAGGNRLYGSNRISGYGRRNASGGDGNRYAASGYGCAGRAIGAAYPAAVDIAATTIAGRYAGAGGYCCAGRYADAGQYARAG